jgi:hypothetical protein
VTLTSSYNLILNYRNYQRPASRVFNDSEAVNFANVEKRAVDRTKVRCFNCSVMGHYTNECSEPKKENDSGYTEGTANVIIGADSDPYDGLDEFMFINQAEDEDSDGISNHYDHMCDAVDFEGFTFHQAARCVNPKWIWLDSQ